MGKKRVLMLGAGPLQVPAIKKARELGLEVCCADYDPEAVGFEYADRVFLVSTTDAEAVLSLAQEIEPDYVITSTSDAPVFTAAYVSEKLGLPIGISSSDAICATQKDAMRERLRRDGVPIPAYRVCANESMFVDAVRSFGFDCVVKPADSAASRGVRLVDCELDAHDLSELYEDTLAFSKKGVVLVEERIGGQEVSVEAMTRDGKTEVIAITDKEITEPPYFVELGHSEPSRLPEEIQEQIISIAVKAINAIGIKTGPSHTEIKVTKDGPKVIEIAARLGGDFITSKLVPLSTGIDLVDESVAAALEEPTVGWVAREQGAAIRFITASRPGVIESIEPDPHLDLIDGFYELVLYKEPGDPIDSPHSSQDRIGHIVCIGDTAEAAIDAVHRIMDKVKVTLI